ncbi:hypothetical protein [Absidia glauca]|uniref:GATA-type domain-containing protein n=1 Tax=Absidia glauca TaxID=4829 RepID=A0A163JFR1_ABSGL|nr:hypothetical protein [Absidia glauca]
MQQNSVSQNQQLNTDQQQKEQLQQIREQQQIQLEQQQIQQQQQQIQHIQQQQQIQREQQQIQQQQQQIQEQQDQIQQQQEKANYFSSDITQIYAERHWSEQLLNDEKVFLFVLSAHGDVLYCSDSCKGLTGHSSNDVVGHTISEFLHPDDHTVFYDMLDKVFETPLRLTQVQFRWKRKEPLTGFTCLQSFGYSKPDDVPTYTITKSNKIESNYYAFFAIAQSCDPSTFDLLMNLKKENQLLQQRLAQLSSTNSTSSPSTNNSNSAFPQQVGESSSSPSSSDSSLTNQPSSVIASWMQSGWHQSNNPWMSLDNINNTTTTTSSASSIKAADDMGEGDTPLPSQPGDVSMTNAGATKDEDSDAKKRKKKVYVTMENYQCSDCGSTNSPEWRKGPLGPKTLCNACGLRWAKKNKKVKIMDQISTME